MLNSANVTVCRASDTCSVSVRPIEPRVSGQPPCSLIYSGIAPTRRAAQLNEEALLRFQHDLSEQDPPGLRASASFRVDVLPLLGNRPGYEDWCLLDGSWALDPLNAFAVAGRVTRSHNDVAAQMEDGHGGLYSLPFGEPAGFS